jgi:hypothetical protein
MMKLFFNSISCWVLAGVLAGSCWAGPIGTSSVAGGILYGTGEEVTIYFRGSEAGFDSRLWLDLEPALGPFFPNHSTAPGTSISLGVVPLNTPLVFHLEVITEPYDWRMGPAGSNSDGQVHARITPWAADPLIPANGFLVGWEDWPGESDFDYNDHEFVAAGVSDTPTPTPEPATFLMLGAALVGLGLVRFRRAR